MSIFLESRRCFLAARTRGVRVFGRGAGPLFLAVVACGALACSDDETDPAEQTGAAGGVNTADASVIRLPGEGLEPTPDYDTDTRQREPIGPQELVKTIDQIRNGIDGTGGTGGTGAVVADAAPPPADVSDAGAD
jgi:hypothetical protein